jgi:hypothetical protein
MKRLLSVLAVVAILGGFLAMTRASQQVPRELKGREFMRRKLEHSQRVLEGVVQADFELIEKNARSLGLLSQAAEWQILASADYRRHSEEFRRTAELLAKSAREKNLDAAALTYVQLTLNCVHCHKYVRTISLDDRRKPAGPNADTQHRTILGP